MKRLSLKLAMAFILAVCSLAGCEKTDSVQGNDEKQSTAASVLTTASVSSESTSTMDATSADETTAVQPTQTEAHLQDKTEATSVEGSESDALTDEQALEAVKNYCFCKNPDLKNKVDSGEYNIYWDVTASNADKIVVLFRSYTSAQIRYYIDPISGETYVTELVPGIIDEEQRTEESFNIRDYSA
ncbi:hypothetical protein [Ruminococcus flavefaciens]|uniref:hypothetical protein n=1 Tax=Ruminococcus flavefaciens TaxID=1265 RepID=UPI0026F1C5B0|nr:hypothetical protein [Ruminococcus flavefaciens]